MTGGAGFLELLLVGMLLIKDISKIIVFDIMIRDRIQNLEQVMADDRIEIIVKKSS